MNITPEGKMPKASGKSGAKKPQAAKTPAAPKKPAKSKKK
jgi:hypothetical protein